MPGGDDIYNPGTMGRGSPPAPLAAAAQAAAAAAFDANFAARQASFNATSARLLATVETPGGGFWRGLSTVEGFLAANPQLAEQYARMMAYQTPPQTTRTVMQIEDYILRPLGIDFGPITTLSVSQPPRLEPTPPNQVVRGLVVVAILHIAMSNPGVGGANPRLLPPNVVRTQAGTFQPAGPAFAEMPAIPVAPTARTPAQNAAALNALESAGLAAQAQMVQSGFGTAPTSGRTLFRGLPPEAFTGGNTPLGGFPRDARVSAQRAVQLGVLNDAEAAAAVQSSINRWSAYFNAHGADIPTELLPPAIGVAPSPVPFGPVDPGHADTIMSWYWFWHDPNQLAKEDVAAYYSGSDKSSGGGGGNATNN